MNRETLRDGLRYRRLRLKHIISHNKRLNSTLKANHLIIQRTEIRDMQNRLKETDNDDNKDI